MAPGSALWNNIRRTSGTLLSVRSVRQYQSGDQQGRDGPLWWLTRGLAGAVATGGLLVAAQAETPPVSKLSEEAEVADWQAVISRCIPAVVAIRVTTPRAFDTQLPGTSVATGFVVDKERGLILTNRHVVKDGPVVAEASFVDHEDVPLEAVYRDPVHDFGIFKFDPAKIRHMKLEELQLRPDCARVGTEIRVLGNNAGEKMSILAGTIARLDRNAPQTGAGTDFNTFYIQAASSTSGGSSGSPVINRAGAAVALNAAGKIMTSVSYYLPLDRVQRALTLLQRGESVPRGTIQTCFTHMTFAELKRLGLSEAHETDIRSRFSQASGMLAVQTVLPGGPGTDLLEPGDILLAINGEVITSFVQLETILDDQVQNSVELRVVRGQTELTVPITVQDLHAITPSRFLEVGGCVLHDLSYHLAMAHHIPVKGVFVAHAGYMLAMAGVSSGSVITRVGNDLTPDLDAIARVLTGLPDGAMVPISLFKVNQPQIQAKTVLKMHRKLLPMQMVARKPDGAWSRTEFPDVEAAATESLPRTTTFPAGANKVEKALRSSLVYISFHMPFCLDSMPHDAYRGTGVIVDAEKGLVIVDRNTVPAALGDLTVNFANSIEVPAKVLYIHPVFNFTVLQYDTSLIGATNIKAVEFAAKAPKVNQSAWLVGLSGSKRLGTQLASSHGRIGSAISNRTAMQSPFAMNMDAVNVKGISGNTDQDGVIVDDDGAMLAYWGAFGSGGAPFLGIPAELIKDIVSQIQQGEEPRLYSLGARLDYLGLIPARAMGLAEEDVRRIETSADAHRDGRQVLVVAQRWYGTAAYDVLQDGDILLEVDHKPVVTFRDVDCAVEGRQKVNVTVYRDGERLQLDVAVFDPALGHTRGADNVILLSGAILQRPPPFLAWTLGFAPDCCYVSTCFKGSPAQTVLPGSCIILEVDDMPTPNLRALTELVRGKAGGDIIRVKYRTVKGRVAVSALRLDQFHWPVTQLSMDKATGDWTRTVL